MDSKLKEIRDLINDKERIENRLAVLLGEAVTPKRGRPRTKQGNVDGMSPATHTEGQPANDSTTAAGRGKE